MSAADLQEFEQVKGLIARGLHVGVLTYAEIATATADLDLEDTEVEELRPSSSAVGSSWSKKSTRPLPQA